MVSHGQALLSGLAGELHEGPQRAPLTWSSSGTGTGATEPPETEEPACDTLSHHAISSSAARSAACPMDRSRPRRSTTTPLPRFSAALFGGTVLRAAGCVRPSGYPTLLRGQAAEKSSRHHADYWGLGGCTPSWPSTVSTLPPASDRSMQTPIWSGQLATSVEIEASSRAAPPIEGYRCYGVHPPFSVPTSSTGLALPEHGPLIASTSSWNGPLYLRMYSPLNRSSTYTSPSLITG
jgi:hypothetical protein